MDETVCNTCAAGMSGACTCEGWKDAILCWHQGETNLKSKSLGNRRRSEKGHYSKLIYKLKDLLEILGVEVQLYCYDLKVSGQTDYEHRTIKLNEPGAKWALCTLAHEGGHWVSYLLWSSLDLTREQREWCAFHLGWYLLESINASISVKDWYKVHEELFDCTCERTYQDWRKENERK